MLAKRISRVHYGRAAYGKEEVRAVVRALKNPMRIGAGEKVREFERKIARLFGKPYGLMVNSCSSANLLALSSLKLPRGSEIITPILTFGTTLAPMIQLGLVPVFADVVEDSFLINVDQIETLITKKTRALMIPSLLGNIPDLARLRNIAKKNKLFFIDDSADTLGGTFQGKPTGRFSDISTTSFYASHVITAAGGGGMVCFHDRLLADRARVLANWGRQSSLFGSSEKSEDIEKRFAGRIEGEIYDAKFIFTEIGYNVQSNELAAAFGLEQLKKLPRFSKIRKSYFKRLYSFFGRYGRFFSRAVQDTRVKTNWLAFPLTVKKDAPFTRAEITRYLEERGIQTRPVFTGNVLRQPAFANIKHGGRGKNGYPTADMIMRQSFLIGCNHALTKNELTYMERVFSEFLKRFE